MSHQRHSHRLRLHSEDHVAAVRHPELQAAAVQTLTPRPAPHNGSPASVQARPLNKAAATSSPPSRPAWAVMGSLYWNNMVHATRHPQKTGVGNSPGHHLAATDACWPKARCPRPALSSLGTLLKASTGPR